MPDGPDPLETGIFIKDDLALGSSVHKNVAQQFIVTTEDKVTICLTRHQEAVVASREWIGPLGSVLSILATLVVTERFRPFLGLNPDQWRAIFILGGVLSSGLLAATLIRTYRKRKERSIDFVINSLKTGSGTIRVEER